MLLFLFFCCCIYFISSTHILQAVSVTYNDVPHDSFLQYRFLIRHSQLDTIEYFPWNDGIDYSSFCKNLTHVLKTNPGPIIIHYGMAGGLTHKFKSLLQDITLALVLKRKLQLNMLDSFWANHDSCLKELQSNETVEEITICYRKSQCLSNPKTVFSLPNKPLFMDDYRISSGVFLSQRVMNKIKILYPLFSHMSSIRYKQVIYRLLSNPNKEVLHAVLEDIKKMDIHNKVVGIHIRCGGFLANTKERDYWILEKELPFLPSYLNKLVSTQSLSTKFYLTTDSIIIEEYINNSLSNFTFFTNTRYSREHTTKFAEEKTFQGAFYDLLMTSQTVAIIYSKGSGYSEAIRIISNTTKQFQLPTVQRKYE